MFPWVHLHFYEEIMGFFSLSNLSRRWCKFFSLSFSRLQFTSILKNMTKRKLILIYHRIFRVEMLGFYHDQGSLVERNISSHKNNLPVKYYPLGASGLGTRDMCIVSWSSSSENPEAPSLPRGDEGSCFSGGYLTREICFSNPSGVVTR